jgi:hypothetical protein
VNAFAKGPEFLSVLSFATPVRSPSRTLRVKSSRGPSSSIVTWHVDATRDCPAPGGEPLWRVADDPAIVVSALNPTKKCRNRRLPGITQRNDFSCGSESFTPGRKVANRWVIPESRLFLHVSAGLVLRRNSRGRKDTRQSGSPPGAGQSRVGSTRHALSRTTTKDEGPRDDFTRWVRLGARIGVATDRTR